MNLSNDPEIVYIAGYGRSGSTLLDTILGNHPDTFGAGELKGVFDGLQGGTACSCGRTMLACSFWQEVRSRLARMISEADLQTGGTATLATESLGLRRRDYATYARVWQAMYGAIGRTSGKWVIVDSSKSCRCATHRLRLLARHVGLPLKVIHLVRDPRAVMWSICRGSNTRLEQGSAHRAFGGAARGMLSWILANLTVEQFRLQTPEVGVFRVRYEDLASDPRQSLEAIGRFLGLDMRMVLDRLEGGEPFDPGHGVGGNRMRRKGNIVMRFDAEWQEKLPGTTRAFARVGWPLMRCYGY